MQDQGSDHYIGRNTLLRSQKKSEVNPSPRDYWLAHAYTVSLRLQRWSLQTINGLLLSYLLLKRPVQETDPHSNADHRTYDNDHLSHLH